MLSDLMKKSSLGLSITCWLLIQANILSWNPTQMDSLFPSRQRQYAVNKNYAKLKSNKRIMS
jgi:hypothetical protein